MNNKKVSIIVAVYNAEETIERSIVSILNQKYENIELIVIDDGSIDGTKEVLKKFTSEDRIKLIFQKNQGVSSARNKGLDSATGEYITFCDADDYLEDNHVDVLVKGFDKNNIDLSVCNYSYVDYKTGKKDTYQVEQGIFDKAESISKILAPNGIQGYLVNKLFKKSIIDKSNLRLNSKIFMSEDLLFCVEYMKKCSKMSVLNDGGYNYILYPNSANKTRLNYISEDSRAAFDNFLYCLDVIIDILSKEEKLALKTAIARKALVSTNYIRALYLLNDNNQIKIKKLRKNIWNSLLNIFSNKFLNIKMKDKIVVLMVLLSPKLIKKRDKIHFSK